MKKYGYIRISSKDQNPVRQREALLQYGIADRNIFMDRMSGKDFNRPQYRRMLKKMHSGDVLVIKSVDRLGRNYEETIEQWRLLCKEKKIDIEVIDFPLLNTNQIRDGLTGIFISDMVLQVLAYFSQTERENIRQRQAEGIAIAKAKGVRFGGERHELPKEFEDYYDRWRDGKISVRRAAKHLGMSHSSFYRRCREKFENDKTGGKTDSKISNSEICIRK